MKPAKLSMKKIGNKVLLDTNIIIEELNGNNEIADKINQVSTFSISSVVLGELYVGVNRISNKQKHLKNAGGFSSIMQRCGLTPLLR